jgi:hypothetical protein
VLSSTKPERSLQSESQWVRMAVPVVSATLNSEPQLRLRRR